uniref:Ankyrin repeat and SOCS box protein 18-like n=1 Tax=Castor canadensis TaxID=51338 RepID=A0A8B7TS32_CASCN|nr:ankyrin repeat and SOCS box protein 18-like [Castor canadensis]
MKKGATLQKQGVQNHHSALYPDLPQGAGGAPRQSSCLCSAEGQLPLSPPWAYEVTQRGSSRHGIQTSPHTLLHLDLKLGHPTACVPRSLQVLRTCAPAPAVIEVLFNSYAQLCVSESWKGVIPEEVFQIHKAFYQSFFALAGTPRSLQHLCRCAIRKLFGKGCFLLVPLLPLPASLQSYLLLEPEGVLH